MKRKSTLKAVLSTTLLTALVGSASIAYAVEPETATMEAKAETEFDAKAIEIIEKSIEETAGREVMENATSVHTTGTINIPMAGLTGTIEVFAAEGGNLLLKVIIPGFGEQLQGLHDGIGWSMDPMGGPKLLEPEMTNELMKQSDPKLALKYEDRYSSIKYVGETEFNGQQVHQIDYISADNGEESIEYYAMKSGLLAGSVATATTEMGKMKVTTIMNEYAEYNGVKMPSKSTEKMGPMSFHTTTDSAEFNNVDMSVFEYPEAIKALIEATKEDSEMMDD